MNKNKRCDDIMELQKTFKGTFIMAEYMVRFDNPAFIKWAGGKAQLIEQYKKLFPPKFNAYFEPFLGSGAIFFYIKQRYDPKMRFLSDVNENLINTFNAVRDQTEDLIKLLKKHKSENHSEEAYYAKRALFNKTTNRLEKAALFIYLNKTCFNGLFRVNLMTLPRRLRRLGVKLIKS